jgi:hypothetical protein
MELLLKWHHTAEGAAVPRAAGVAPGSRFVLASHLPGVPTGVIVVNMGI